MATSDNPNHLERVLQAMPAEDVKALTIHMTDLTCDYFAELAKAMPEDELRRKAADGSLVEEVKQKNAARLDDAMRRWLIAHGYL